MSDGVLLAACVLGAYRLTRLVTADVVADRPRQWLIRRGGWAGDLVGCPACSGAWVSAGVVVAVWAFHGLTLPGLWFAAVAGGQVPLSFVDILLERRMHDG